MRMVSAPSAPSVLCSEQPQALPSSQGCTHRGAWFEAGGGWKGKDFGESNLMYHLTWKFCFQQGLFMDPFCSLLNLTDSLLKYFKVLSQRAVTVILGTTHKEELSLYNLPAGFSCRGIISFAAAALWPCSEPSCAQPHSLCHPPALCP